MLRPCLFHSQIQAKLKRINSFKVDFHILLHFLPGRDDHLHLHIWLLQRNGGLSQERLHKYSQPDPVDSIVVVLDSNVRECYLSQLIEDKGFKDFVRDTTFIYKIFRNEGDFSSLHEISVCHDRVDRFDNPLLQLDQHPGSQNIQRPRLLL